jgi:DNA-binding CsgD family transcriptional regulator/tetratricopeptide (TPR) repeat protein
VGARAVTDLDASLAISRLLSDASLSPAALILDGEPGIGKTTLWLAAVDSAEERGFRVLGTRPSASESVMGYTALADLLGSVAPSTWATLPTPQRRAVDRITLRTSDEDGQPPTDQRAVAAGFLAVVDHLAREGPVLLAIDDLQWLDSSSVHVLEFVARRLRGPVGLLGTVRTMAAEDSAAWFQTPQPARLNRITLRPLTVGALHAVLSQRLGHSYPRPTMLRIHETSGGNPFYAIELARSIDDRGSSTKEVLPRSLTELVNHRIDSLEQRAQGALLASSCLAAPTIEIVAQATETEHTELVALLEPAEQQGIVSRDGNRIRFAHPILAKGVYQRASPTARRAMHRRLAGLIDEPESQARQLALAATTGDPATLSALDAAAEIARSRGAPEASAELVNLAIALGGDTPERRLSLAGSYFNSGDSERARTTLDETIAALDPGALRSRAFYLLGVVRMFDDSFPEAADLLERALAELDEQPVSRAELLIILSFAQVNSDRAAEALACVDEAVTLSEELQQPHLLGQALGMRTTLRFMQGDGLDRKSLDHAVEVEDLRVSTPIALRPSAQSALLAAWSGELDRARRELATVRRRCIEHGEDSELIFVSFHNAMLNVWRGEFRELAREAEETMERALQLNGDVPRYVALMTRALSATFGGDIDAGRRDSADALAAAVRSGAMNLAQWPLMTMGFIEVTTGNYDAALSSLEPLLTRLAAEPKTTEIISAWFLPDAIEAMTQVGRLDDAERWAELLVANGARLDRAWMLAVGGRCRGLVLASRGDLEGALEATEGALAQHERVPMPFERARTRLLHGRLQRRLRRQDLAATTLRATVDEFERLGTPLWADHARDQLARTNIGPRETAALTPSELRVAELAATGMTNRDMATTLFISPKTVEATLSRVYRKLNIHSRAELGRRMSEL